MRQSDIAEGKSYAKSETGIYFRTVEFLIDAPKVPGGKLVVWHTEGFAVRDRAHKTHGRCGIETFARWALKEV